MDNLFAQASQLFHSIQDKLCADLVQLETSPRDLVKDDWESALGSGCTAILQGGELWEKAGVAVSRIAGEKLPPAASSRNPQLAGQPYQASGVSVVIHPRNPYVPTCHSNFRVFTVGDAASEPAHWWFGGGCDLTPYYLEPKHYDLWHGNIRACCDEFEPGLYEKFSRNCDEYFYLPHRQESRGIGGMFFDDFNPWEAERCLEFVTAAAECFRHTYLTMADELRHKDYGETEREFQLYRRGRYVEFNLLYDRGTLFGLQSGGRTESILMSLPPKVRWDYNRSFAASSPEAAMEQRLKRPAKDPAKD